MLYLKFKRIVLSISAATNVVTCLLTLRAQIFCCGLIGNPEVIVDTTVEFLSSTLWEFFVSVLVFG